MDQTAVELGVTGGVYIEFDAASSAFFPTGRMFYDIELVNGEEVTTC